MPDVEIREKEDVASDSALEGLFHLILLDDNDHTYEYVVEMLGRVLGYGRHKAFAIACVVDSQGQAVLETASHDQCTRHQRMIHSFGADPRITRCQGSMSAVVEPAP
jgi:ATP-dependent Clp protease adaptor protein ClpS